MNILDKFKLTNKKKKTPQVSQVELGAPGTELFSGFLSEEFNPDLKDRQGILMFDKMRKNDAQVFASLNAVKYPLLSAKWFIEPAKGEDVDEDIALEQAQFIENNLMNELKWKKQLKLILTYLDFGFKYLEKIFGMDEQARVVWTKWGDRQQTAHYKWESDTGERGAQQQLPNSEDVNNSQPFMPMRKLLLFSLNREGNNFAGVSMLRTAYKHWWFKDTLYKIQGISAERYGVGIPLIYTGDNSSADDKTKAENMGKNMRSNETSYIVAPGNPNSKNNPGWKIDILTPKGDSKAPAIKDAIDHHNRMIVMNILAPFLDLGSGSGGSFALSKDQSSFFLLSLKAIADDVKEVVNEAIEELILMNWPGTKIFPKLDVTEIAKPDLQEFSMALNTLVAAGLIEVDDELLRFVRNTMKLPDKPEEVKKPDKDDKEEDDKDDQEEEEKKKEEEKKEDKDNFKEEEKTKKKLFKVTKKTNEKPKKKNKLIKLSKREQLFLDAQKKNESIIDSSLDKFEEELTETEKQLKTFLTNKIEKTDIKNKSNYRLLNELKSAVTDIIKKFQQRTSNGTLSKNMIKDIAKVAIETTQNLDNSTTLSTILLTVEPQIKSFMSGHISKVNALIVAESQKILKDIHENITQKVSVSEIKENISKIKFDRNVFTSPPRELFKSIIGEELKKEFKTLLNK